MTTNRTKDLKNHRCYAWHILEKLFLEVSLSFSNFVKFLQWRKVFRISLSLSKGETVSRNLEKSMKIISYRTGQRKIAIDNYYYFDLMFSH